MRLFLASVQNIIRQLFTRILSFFAVRKRITGKKNAWPCLKGTGAMRFLLFYRINEACAGSSGSPDVHPVGRREIHTVSLCDSIEVQELVILLEGAVDA